MGSNVDNIIQLPILLSVTMDSNVHIINIKTNADITKYNQIFGDFFVDLDLKIISSGLSVKVSVLEKEKDIEIKIKKEIDELNSKINQITQALTKSNIDLMFVGNEHYKKIKNSSENLKQNEMENIVTHMMEYQI